MKVKLRRIFLKIKLKELSEKTGLSKQYLSDLENGKYANPTKGTMVKIADALNTTVYELFFCEEA